MRGAKALLFLLLAAVVVGLAAFYIGQAFGGYVAGFCAGWFGASVAGVMFRVIQEPRPPVRRYLGDDR